MYRIIGTDGKEYGPVAEQQLRQWIAEGRVNAGTRAKAEGGEWRTLSQFPEFTAVMPPPSMAPPAFPTTAPGQPASEEAPRTSGMAITSLVLGILGLFTCGLTALVGLILGIIAQVKIKKSEGRLTGSGLAISGICVSAAFLLMLPLMAALFFPAFAKAKQTAMGASCKNNLMMLGITAIMYTDENKDQFPPAATWSDAMANNIDEDDLHCRADQQRLARISGGAKYSSYAFNRALSGRNMKDVNPKTVMFFESNLGWNGSGGPESITSHGHTTGSGPNRGEEMINVVRVDGTAEAVPRSRLGTLRWNP